MQTLAHVSLFTGIGGWEYALQLAQIPHRTVLYCEINPYRQEVIRQRIRDGIFHDGPIWPDVRTLDGHPFAGRVGILTASFPCEFISRAGRRDMSKNLWPETRRIIGAMGPSIVLLENTTGLLSGYSGVPYILAIAGDLTSLGYSACWGALGAHDVGAPHLRERLWILAYSSGERYRLAARPVSAGRHGAKHSDWWEAEPKLGRVADGLPHRRQRVEALGDGLVPAVAAAFLRRVLAA